VIDSYRSRTAKQADWHIMPKPGTDGAFAMGVIAGLIENGLVDREWVVAHTVGFEELAERAKQFTPAYVERITGVPASDVARFAHDFAKAQPSVIRMGVALERHAAAARPSARSAHPALAAQAPCRRRFVAMPLWEFPVDWQRVSRPDFIAGHAGGEQPPARPGFDRRDEARSADHGLYIYNTNPVSQAPETNKIVKGLRARICSS
jgi:anaerobic selenocysteine-containing dehydrogenase